MPSLAPPKPSSQTPRSGHSHGQLRKPPRSLLQRSSPHAHHASASPSQSVQGQQGTVLGRLMYSVLSNRPVAWQQSGASGRLHKDNWRFGQRRLVLRACDAAVPAPLGRFERVRPENVVPRASQAPRSTQLRSTTWPNNSFNRTRYGRPPWPGRRYAVHFRQPGQGVLPPRAG
jgi:hypothetical protein